MIKEAIAKIVGNHDLSEAEMMQVMDEIMEGLASPTQIGAFLVGLRMKGETEDEITGAARVMRAKATRVDADGISPLVDTCGTGGDGSGTFNVSTATALVVAGAGVAVAKHGNRSVSSKCGSADVLEALGVDLGLSPEKIASCIRETGIGFLFAPALHGAMKHAAGPRRELGIRSIFNVLGPLTNPAGATAQLMGVFAPELTEAIARVLGRLGSRHALVVCGEGNLDELTVTGDNRVSEWHAGKVVTFSLSPEDLGLKRARLQDIKGGETPAAAAAILKDVLAGQPGPRLDMTLLNAAAALVAADKAVDFKDGLTLAREAVASGKAMARLEALLLFCRQQRS